MKNLVGYNYFRDICSFFVKSYTRLYIYIYGFCVVYLNLVHFSPFFKLYFAHFFRFKLFVHFRFLFVLWVSLLDVKFPCFTRCSHRPRLHTIKSPLLRKSLRKNVLMQFWGVAMHTLKTIVGLHVQKALLLKVKLWPIMNSDLVVRCEWCPLYLT